MIVTRSWGMWDCPTHGELLHRLNLPPYSLLAGQVYFGHTSCPVCELEQYQARQRSKAAWRANRAAFQATERLLADHRLMMRKAHDDRPAPW